MSASEARSIGWAVLAAALYALNAPLSKLLLQDIGPTMMASLLYLGAGAGMLLLGLARRGLVTYQKLAHSRKYVILVIAIPMP